MIRYAFDRAEVEADIRSIDARWFEKAARRTAGFVQAGKFDETSSIWNVVKPVFMRRQMNKCVFCERQFENAEYGTIEFDLEHFRPKGAVKAWPDAGRHPNLAYRFATGAASAGGYFWLAYEIGNYAASCKVCNTTFKLDYFPVAGSRGAPTASPSDLQRERPFLCYPLGGGDDDPEELVTFIATTAVPAARSGHKRRRGQIIIDFFGLNAREQLHRERARMISLFGGSLLARAEGRASAADLRVAQRVDSPMLPHAGCVRAFKRACDTDAARARRIHELCQDFAFADEGTAPPDL